MISSALSLVLVLAAAFLAPIPFYLSPALVFIVAALLSLPRPIAPFFAAFSLAASLSTLPQPAPFDSWSIIGLTAAGLALGLWGRSLDDLRRSLDAAWLTPLLVGALTIMATLIPDGLIWLSNDAGQWHGIEAIVIDGPTFLRQHSHIQTPLPLAHPAALLKTAALALGLALFFFASVQQLRKTTRFPRRGLVFALYIAAPILLLISSAWGLTQLMGPLDLEPENIRHSLELTASRDGSILEVMLGNHSLRLWSRPWVDLLGLLAALSALALIFIPARPPTTDAPAPGSLSLPIPLALLAVSVSILALGMRAPLAGTTLALLAGAVMGLGVLASRLQHPQAAASLSQFWAMAAVLGAWCYAWLIPGA